MQTIDELDQHEGGPLAPVGLPTDKSGVPADVIDYYRQTIDDYQLWSAEGYMHFGLWRFGLNPFNRREMLEAMNELVFQELELADRSNLQVGDFGCGVGAVSRYGCQRFPNHHWHAVTICDRQIEYGRSLMNSYQRSRIEMIQADFCELPYENESLDAIFFLESLCHADGVSAALQESRRVLKPGGRLVVVDGLLRHTSEDTPAYARRLAKIVAENWAVGEFHSLPSFEEAAAATGFEITTKRELGWQITPCVAHSPLLVGWHSIGLIATARWTAWKRKHMIACGLGVMLGCLRTQFGYYLHTLRKKSS